jgi:protein gp37
MAETKIEWTAWQDGAGNWRPGFTFNPWIGCQRISPGCDRCYAADLSKRYGWVTWGDRKTETTAASVGERKRTGADNWRKPRQWAGIARKVGGRPKVFCASLADVFDNQVDEQWRIDLWRLIWETPELDWLLLTKRPENVERFLPASWTTHRNEWAHVWLGFTAEDQPHFDRRWPIMRDIPASVRFCSYEPAIGPLRLFDPITPIDVRLPALGLHWLICGGESGHGYRELRPEWEAGIRYDCHRFGVAYYFKQMPGKKPIPTGFEVVRQFPSVTAPSHF